MPRKKPDPPSTFNPDTVLNEMDFDSLEEKIRGEEILSNSDTRSQREAHDVKKKIDQSEIDRRLAELKKKIK